MRRRKTTLKCGVYERHLVVKTLNKDSTTAAAANVICKLILRNGQRSWVDSMRRRTRNGRRMRAMGEEWERWEQWKEARRHWQKISTECAKERDISPKSNHARREESNASNFIVIGARLGELQTNEWWREWWEELRASNLSTGTTNERKEMISASNFRVIGTHTLQCLFQNQQFSQTGLDSKDRHIDRQHSNELKPDSVHCWVTQLLYEEMTPPSVAERKWVIWFVWIGRRERDIEWTNCRSIWSSPWKVTAIWRFKMSLSRQEGRIESYKCAQTTRTLLTLKFQPQSEQEMIKWREKENKPDDETEFDSYLLSRDWMTEFWAKITVPPLLSLTTPSERNLMSKKNNKHTKTNKSFLFSHSVSHSILSLCSHSVSHSVLSFCSHSVSHSAPFCLSFFLSFCLSICLSFCLSLCLSICFSHLHKINEPVIINDDDEM